MAGTPIIVYVSGGLQDLCGFKKDGMYLTHDDDFPVEHNLHGFCLNFSDAEWLVLNNEGYSDDGYYQYVVIEEYREGVYMHSQKSCLNQTFYKVTKTVKDREECFRYEKLASPPQELVDIYEEHQVVMNFAF
jgi:hypothetical protein